jgi:hypothetical protein
MNYQNVSACNKAINRLYMRITKIKLRTAMYFILMDFKCLHIDVPSILRSRKAMLRDKISCPKEEQKYLVSKCKNFENP